MTMTAASFALPMTAVLFDLDGTLADTAGDLGGAVNQMRVARGMPAMSIELLRPYASAGARGLIGVGLKAQPDQPDFEDLRQEFLANYESSLANTTKLFDGVPSLLDQLDAMGCPWGVVTNKPHRYTVPVMQALGLMTRSAVTISGDSTAHAKPHPLPLLTACEHMGVSPGNTLYVGDDLRDIQAAQAAHMPSVAAAWGYLGTTHDIAQWGADVICPQPMDIIALMSSQR
jgi:N-acetyl-D-muramate 6-phosphate phosphatase